MNLIVLKQWFSTRGYTSPGGVNKFPAERELLRPLYNMESLIKIFTNKYICFYNIFNVGGLGTKDDYFEAGVV